MNIPPGVRLWVALLGAFATALAAATVSPAGGGQLVAQARCAAQMAPLSSAATTITSRRRPVGKIVATISTADPSSDDTSDPYGIAVGEGSVWVADRGLNSVLRINTARNRVAARIPVDGGPSRLAVGDGSAWVVQQDPGNLVRVDLATKTVVATISLGGVATGQPALGAGSVWVLDGTHRQIVRIDPTTNTEIGRIDVGGTGDVGGVLFAYGSIWAASHGDAQVVRVDPATNTVTTRVALRHRADRPAIAMDPQAIARGSVWVANTDVNARGYHIVAAVTVGTMTADPRRVPVVRSELVGLAHLGRSIWATDATGTLWRINAVTHKVLGRVAVCAKTAYVAAAAGSIWAIDPMGASLVRVRPLH